MFHPKSESEKLTKHEELLSLTLLLLLDEKVLVADESDGLSPALEKNPQSSSSL